MNIKNQKNTSTAAPALERGIRILELLSREGPMPLTTIGDALQVPRASLERLLDSLEAAGFIHLSGDRRYAPGLHFQYLAMLSYDRDPLHALIRPMLKRLAYNWKQTFVVYEYRSPFQLIWRIKEEPDGGIKTQSCGHVSDRLNMNAQGQWFLSLLSDQEVRSFANSPACTPATEWTLTKPAELLTRIHEIQVRGYAYQERENSPVMKQFAVPLQLPSYPERPFALGCFLPLDFADAERLRDGMLLESGKLSASE